MKFFKNIFIVIAMFLLFNSVTYALTYNNKTSLSVGVDYGDGTSGVDHATNSYNTYKNMGLTSKLITNTTESNMKSSHNNGTHYLESGIVYLVGHSSYMSMSFINGVTIDRTSSSMGADLGIGMYNNNKIAFMTIAGCQTAKDNVTNIAKSAYDYGTKIVLGWKTDLNISSYKNWNKRFNEIIKDKKTSVLDAAKSASNHIYLSNTVKNYKFYGQYNKNPWYFLNTALIATNNLNYSSNNLDSKTNLDYSVIEDYLKNNVKDLNVNNFKLEINGVHETYYDYVLYINGIRTNLGYTIVEDNINHNLKFIDNMNNFSYNEVVKLISDADTKNIKSADNGGLVNVANHIDVKDDYEIIKKEKFFDADVNKLYFVIDVRLKDGENGTIVSYLGEI